MSMARGASSDNLMIQAYGAGTPDKLLKRFHEAYKKSAVRTGSNPDYSAEQMRHHMDTGHVIVGLVVNDWMGGERAAAVFGIELMQDGDGPFMQYLFMYGDALEHMAAITAATFAIWRQHADLVQFHGEGRMRIAGRRGWERVLNTLGLRYATATNGDFWVPEWQPAFGFTTMRMQ